MPQIYLVTVASHAKLQYMLHYERSVQLMNASHSSYAWPSTSVCTEWDRYICRRCAGHAGRRHLRSANRGQLVVPRYRLTTAGRRAFSCAGPSVWNSIPEYLTVDTLTWDYFKRSLKCFLFARYWHSAWSA